MHDATTILGHIIESYAVDKSGTKLETMPSEVFDVEVAGVLYSGLDELAERIGEIMNKAQSNEIFVSMEALFTKFAYGLIDPATNTTHIIEREEDTAFLTKHLRIYGGTGEYEGYQVGRVLQDFVFGGKGIVDEPANPESVIRVAAASQNFENNILETLPEGGVKSMTEQEIKALQEQMEEKDAVIAKLTEESAAKVGELSAKVEELTNAVAETEKSLAETTERAEKVEAELSTIKKMEKARERFVKLSAVRDVEDEKATMADLLDMEDGDFERLMKYAGPAKAEEGEGEKEEDVEPEPEPEKEKEAVVEDETEAATAALDEVEESNEPDFQGGTDNPEEAEAQEYLALAHVLLSRQPEKKE
jgi:hypothetical protein